MRELKFENLFIDFCKLKFKWNHAEVSIYNN